MVHFPWTVSHNLGQFFSNFQGFISCGFVGSREIHSDRAAFIRGQSLYKFMHFLLICLINNVNNNYMYIFFFFNTVYVFPVHAVLFIFIMPVGDMSMFFLVGVCNESICLQNIL